MDGEKDRPVLVLRQEGDDEYLCIKITGTNYTNRKEGYWIDKNHPEYWDMNLDKPSFISLTQNGIFKSYMINHNSSPFGQCSEDFFKEIEEKCDSLGI